MSSHATKMLSLDDIEMLRKAVDWCGGYTERGFKPRLIGSLEQLYDSKRRGRLLVAIKHLAEDEILELCGE